MTENEVSIFLKEAILELKQIIDNVRNSDEYLSLESQIENLENQVESEENEKLADELYNKQEQLEENAINEYLSKITQEQMKDILLTLSPEFMESNHFGFNNNALASEFHNIIQYFIENLNDPNHQLHNSLLNNENFISSIESNVSLLNSLIIQTNNEQAIMSFLQRYSTNFGTADVKIDDFHTNDNISFGNVFMNLIDSPNYSLDFKQKLLNNDEMLNYLGEFTLNRIIIESQLPQNIKFNFLLKEQVFEKLSDYYFSEALASIYNNINDLITILENQKIYDKINFGYLLSKVNIDENDLLLILNNDKIMKKLDWLEIGTFVSQNPHLTFELRKKIIFNENIYSKLNELAVSNLLISKYLTKEQRNELLENTLISKFLNRQDVISMLLEANTLSLEEKVAIIKDKRFRQYIDNRTLEIMMMNPNLDLDIATDLISDKNLFYILIDEYNEEYNPKKYTDNKGPFKYDKYEYMQRLLKKNPYLARTFSFELLKDDILDLGYDFIERISKYPFLARNIASMYGHFNSPIFFEQMTQVISNSIYASEIDMNLFTTKLIKINNDNSFFDKDINKRKKLSIIKNTAHLDWSKMTPERWKILTEIGLRDMSSYYNGISATMFGPIVDEIDISLNILPDINNLDDLDNYHKRRLLLCDEIFQKCVNSNDLNGAINAYLNKYFSINIQEAEQIVRMYGSSINQFSTNNNYNMQVKYIQSISKILSISKIDTIKQCYFDNDIQPLSFDESIYIDQSIRRIFSKDISDSTFKINSSMQSTYIEIPVNINGKNVMQKIPVYEPGLDFKMLIHSTDAYGSMELINNNYFDSWNKSGRKSNHGICCSFISNDNMGMAAVNDVLFGFDSWDPKAVTKIAPYDIYSSNDDHDIQEGRPLTFMSAQDIIDNTRHTHNEMVLERLELRDDRRTPECQNIQPSYVIIYSDMPDEIKAKAVKCSNEMNIPIVYLDKEKIIANEVSKIDSKISKIYLSETNMDAKLELVEQVLLSHENNRSGLRMTNNDWLDKYFPTSKIDSIINYLIRNMQQEFERTQDIASYLKYSSQLMDILDKENEKFNVTMENVDRKNYIDIPVEEYKSRIMQFINQDFCKYNIPKLETIIQNAKDDNLNTPLAETLKSVDIDKIREITQDMIDKNLYDNNGKNHNIGHIERVLLLSELIGNKELIDENGQKDNHAIELLTQCAKYHDCGRLNDSVDKNHGKKSADKMDKFLSEEGYSSDDRKIMKIAVEYHEMKDDDFRFEKLCEKYNLSSDKIEYAKKIAQCLKDADALDRTRFKNPNAKLDKDLLRLSTSKDFVIIAEMLNREYEIIDRKQFEIVCRQIIQQQMQSHNNSLVNNDVIDSINQIEGGRRI